MGVIMKNKVSYGGGSGRDNSKELTYEEYQALSEEEKKRTERPTMFLMRKSLMFPPFSTPKKKLNLILKRIKLLEHWLLKK